MAKKTTPTPTPAVPKRGLGRHPDGHYLLDGARWHTAKTGNPDECVVTDCDYEMGAWRNYDPLAAFGDDLDDPDDADEFETQPA